MKKHHACHIKIQYKFNNIFFMSSHSSTILLWVFFGHFNIYLRFYVHINTEPVHVSFPVIRVTVL